MRYILFIFALSFALPKVSQAQKFKKKRPLMVRKDRKMSSRKTRDMIDFRAYKYGGWYIDPGFTYTMEESNFLGGLGYYLGFGRYQIMYEGGTFLNYIDYGVALKNLKKNPLKTHNAVASFNANNIWQFSDKTFLQNSLGVNVDYSINNGLPSSPFAQLHYKIGIGFQFWERLFLIPTVETPILNAYPWDGFNSAVDLNDVKYRSIIFTLRIAWLQKQKAGYSCGKPGKKNKRLKPGNQDTKAQERYNNR